ncbi:MAG: lipocalin family protein [Candidatus Cloacimonetes bacterium]|nr:lipocalin family protein [Candidatus Cloacimonadota bacterium]
MRSWFLLLLPFFLVAGEVETVDYVDLTRYVGKWYEISKFPNRFQRNCNSSVAEYFLNDNGTIRVVNSCETPSGMKTAKAKAWVVDKSTNAKLKVSFFWPFRGNYWILDLGENYEYAVVGEPKRKYLWILSRTPQLDDLTYQKILTRLELMEYDTSLLQPSK